MFEEASQIGTFNSWLRPMRELMSIAREADEVASSRSDDVDERRMFVYGVLFALNKAYSWDMVTQDEDTEDNVLWMFTNLIIR